MILGITLLAATALSLILLSRRLPLQNVIAVAIIIAFVSTSLEIFAVRLGYPAHSSKFMNSSAVLLFGTIPGFLPFVWIAAVILVRLAVKAMLRSQTHRGLIILLSSGLAISGALFVMEQRFTGVFQPKLFLSLCVIAYAVLICITPWMLDKRSAYATGQKPPAH
jgi:uncharacterized membrane protein